MVDRSTKKNYLQWITFLSVKKNSIPDTKRKLVGYYYGISQNSNVESP